MVTPVMCCGERIGNSSQYFMPLESRLFHPQHLSLSWPFDIIRHSQAMIRPCTLMAYLRWAREAFLCFRWPNSPPFSGLQHPKTKPPYGVSPASPPRPMKLIISHKIWCLVCFQWWHAGHACGHKQLFPCA
jgi:hypothetical protein